MIFGTESKLRKEALNKMEEIMAKEHEMLSLGGQAAAAAHSLRNSFINNQNNYSRTFKQFKDQKDIDKILNYYQVKLKDVIKF